MEADKFGRSSRGLLELNFWPPVANLGIGGHLGSVAGDALTNITSPSQIATLDTMPLYRMIYVF